MLQPASEATVKLIVNSTLRATYQGDYIISASVTVSQSRMKAALDECILYAVITLQVRKYQGSRNSHRHRNLVVTMYDPYDRTAAVPYASSDSLQPHPVFAAVLYYAGAENNSVLDCRTNVRQIIHNSFA